MKQNGIQRQREETFGEFMDVTIQLSQEELQAVHGIVPMTQELFDRCAEKCEGIGGVRQLERLIAEFPEQYRSYCERLRCTEGDPENVAQNASKSCTSAQEVSADKMGQDAAWQKINSQLEKLERS